MGNTSNGVKMWDRKSLPVDGQVMTLNLTFKRQEQEYKDATGAVLGKTVYLVNIGEGKGKFRHGVTIATLPNGDRVTLEVRVKLLPVANNPVTIQSSQFSIGE